VISPTAVIHPGVVLGQNVRIEDYCIIGVPVSNEEETLETVIGDDAIIRSFTVIYAGNRIGRGFQTGNKANIRESNIIGDYVSVGTLSVVEHHVTIGSGVRIHSQAFVPEFSRLGEGSWIGPSAVLTNARYPQGPGVKESLQGPVLGRRAKVGANVTILPGVTVGDNSLIGAGSVVTRDVPRGVIVAGAPAKVLREIDY
jgi:acetyltransferase-like isoleucine patch superfamily enzyme